MSTEIKYQLPEGLPIPRPQRDGLDKEFWDATRRHELVVQRCNNCSAFQWGPEIICHQCHSTNLGWHRVSGRGKLYSWTRSWNPVHPALREAVPYLIVVVQIPDADNIRMVGNLVGDPKQEPRFDAEVEAVFEDHPAATLVQWRMLK
jgi:uncharacterized OB-fold protein